MLRASLPARFRSALNWSTIFWEPRLSGTHFWVLPNAVLTYLDTVPHSALGRKFAPLPSRNRSPVAFARGHAHPCPISRAALPEIQVCVCVVPVLRSGQRA